VYQFQQVWPIKARREKRKKKKKKKEKEKKRKKVGKEGKDPKNEQILCLTPILGGEWISPGRQQQPWSLLR
jgi:hypothetical protein